MSHDDDLAIDMPLIVAIRVLSAAEAGEPVDYAAARATLVASGDQFAATAREAELVGLSADHVAGCLAMAALARRILPVIDVLERDGFDAARVELAAVIGEGPQR